MLTIEEAKEGSYLSIIKESQGIIGYIYIIDKYGDNNGGGIEFSVYLNGQWGNGNFSLLEDKYSYKLISFRELVVPKCPLDILNFDQYIN